MRRAGLTLIEVLVVLAILVAIATLAVPMLADISYESIDATTKISLQNLRDAILGRYYNDMRGVPIPRHDVMGGATSIVDNDTGIPNSLADLVIKPDGAPDFDPVSKLGWRGPYVQTT